MLVPLFRLFSRLPLPVLHALGVVLGWLVYLVSPSYRRRLKENITQAGFRSHLRRAIGEAGKSIAELPFVWFAPHQKVAASAGVADPDSALALILGTQGVLFMTPHLGCFEMLAQKISAMHPLTVLYRPPRKAALQPLLMQGRTRPDLGLAPANTGGVRAMLRALRNGDHVGLLPDQVPQQGEGVWADFFGRPAYTMTLPARLHDITGAPIVITYAVRRPFGRGFVMHFTPFTGRLDGTPEQQARAINAAMEEVIARHPEQYLWSYNRYKVPRGVAAPLAATQEQAG